MEAREGAAAEAADAAVARIRLVKNEKGKKVILHLIVSIYTHFNRAVKSFLKKGKSLRSLIHGSKDYILTVENMTESKLVISHSRDITLIVMQSYPLLIM